jgi:hypothetical protein
VCLVASGMNRPRASCGGNQLSLQVTEQSVSSRRATCTAPRPDYLLLKHLFNLADFLLDFTGNFFGLTFVR